MSNTALAFLTEKLKKVCPTAFADEHNTQIVLHPTEKWVGLSLRLINVTRYSIPKPAVFNLWIKGGQKLGKVQFREWLRIRLGEWYFCKDGIVDLTPPRDNNPDYGNAAAFSPGCSWTDESEANIVKIFEAFKRLDEKLQEIHAYDFQPNDYYIGSDEEKGDNFWDYAISDNHEIGIEEIPDVVYPEDVIVSSEIKDPVLSWVTTVDDLFNRNPIVLPDKRKMKPGMFVIPNYQRKYAWEARQIGQLCRDLLHASNAISGCSYHLGTLIFHRDPEKDFFYVVDGQQRLTTISRLLGRKLFHTPTDSLSEKICDQQFTDKDKRLIDTELRKYVELDRNKILSVLAKSTLVCIAVTDITESFQLFSTQNGRGRPLTPVNLLKAFHFHEVDKLNGTALAISEEKCKKIDEEWEEKYSERTLRDGRLLSQVVGEHLYRLRNWCRGVFPEEAFSNASIDEFKGLTMDSGDNARIPLQNLAVLRHKFYNGEMAVEEQMLARRAENDGMNHFVSVDQPIINGEDFFAYAISYAKAYDLLFCNKTGMEEFRGFYMEKCVRYPGFGRRGDTYARHIFESLALFCFDRFGAAGLGGCMRELFCCAYYERLVKSRCYYSTCGSEFAIKAVRCMLRSMTLQDLKDQLQDLCLEVLDKVRERFKNDRNAKFANGLETVKSVFEGK